MRRFFIMLFCWVFTIASVFGQAKKPSIIVLPSMDWCQTSGFVKSELIFDQTKVLPDYDRALLTSPLLNDVLAVISNDMTTSGFPPIMLREQLKRLEIKRARDQARRSSTGGVVKKSSLDLLREVARADIEFHIFWEIESNGPRWRIKNYRLEGIDAYTTKPCGLAKGQGNWVYKNDVTESQLLTEAIAGSMDGFRSQLQTHFDDLFTNGREIVVRVLTMDNWSKDLRTRDYGSKKEQLSVIIENWVRTNTVNGRFDSPLVSEYSMDFTGVRIPLFSSVGAMDANMFGNNLMTYLISMGFNEAEISVTNFGLGEVEIVLGPI